LFAAWTTSELFKKIETLSDPKIKTHCDTMKAKPQITPVCPLFVERRPEKVVPVISNNSTYSVAQDVPPIHMLTYWIGQRKRRDIPAFGTFHAL
jgi:hypothetical protein